MKSVLKFTSFVLPFLLLLPVLQASQTPLKKEPQSRTGVSTEQRAIVNRIISKYRKAGLIETALEKKTFAQLLGRETAEKGRLYFSAGLIRYESEGSEAALVVFDGNYLWNVQLPDKDFGGEPIVYRAKIDSKNRQQVIVTELLTKESLFKHFNLDSAESKGDDMILSATPKKQDWNLAKIKMHFDLKTDVVSRIEYWDDLNNHSDLKLADQKFSDEKKNKLFSYKPPKGTKVNEL